MCWSVYIATPQALSGVMPTFILPYLFGAFMVLDCDAVARSLENNGIDSSNTWAAGNEEHFLCCDALTVGSLNTSTTETNLCTPTNTPTTITFSALPYTTCNSPIEYRWLKSSYNPLTKQMNPFETIAGATSLSYTPPTNLTTTTKYVAQVKTGTCDWRWVQNEVWKVIPNYTVKLRPDLWICPGSEIDLTAKVDHQEVDFLWSTGENAYGIVVQPTSSTTYTVTATFKDSGCKSTATVTVFVDNDCREGCLPDDFFTSSPSGKVSNVNWLGFGWNQEAVMRNKQGFTTWDPTFWNTTTSRIKHMRPGLVRIVFYRDWFNPSGKAGDYTWESTPMQEAIRMLQFYESEGIAVMTGIWNPALLASPSLENDDAFITSDKFATLQADLIEHLLKTKALDNIKYYAPLNEPLAYYSFDAWSLMVKNLHKKLITERLPTQLLVGADSWDDWTQYAARYNPLELSAYEYHHYLNAGTQLLIGGGLETYFSDYVAKVRAIDATKPIFLSEAAPDRASGNGVDYWYFFNKVGSPYNPTRYSYGLNALDYGIQAARAGNSAVLMWALDGYGAGKDPGMWNVAGDNGGMKLRPWYYTWSLLSRYFPAGNTEILMMSQPDDEVRILGAKIMLADSNSAHFSFALVNKTRHPKCINIKLPEYCGLATFDSYTYSEDQQGDGVSLALPKVNGSTTRLSDGYQVIVPANSGMVLTTLENAPVNKTSPNCLSTSLNEISSSQTIIYPNPSTGLVYLKNDTQEIRSIAVFNQYGGKLSLSGDVLRSGILLQTPGLYLIEVTFKNGTAKMEKCLIVR